MHPRKNVLYRDAHAISLCYDCDGNCPTIEFGIYLHLFTTIILSLFDVVWFLGYVNAKFAYS